MRLEHKNNFLKNYFKNKNYNVVGLPSDASMRNYERITTSSSSYILMDCPPQHYPLYPFIKMAEFLQQHNFSAPKIYDVNHEFGFLILEDFGDISMSKFRHC